MLTPQTAVVAQTFSLSQRCLQENFQPRGTLEALASRMVALRHGISLALRQSIACIKNCGNFIEQIAALSVH
jgi:hypothetical protein